MSDLAAVLPTENPRWITVLARVGLVAKGVSYAIVALLAIRLAIGGGGKATSREGALATVADDALGKALLVGLALGFACYAAWRFADALFGRRGEDDDDASGVARRAGFAGRGLVYASLTLATVRLVTRPGERESQTSKARKTTSTVLDWPAGTWLVGLAGLTLVGAGVFNGYRAATRSFLDHWDTSDAARPWATRIGVVGLTARMVVFVLIGGFLCKAAIEYDPKEAIGLDGALQKLANASHGPILLGLVATGLL
ncbi:MAG: DUF1206 domain-containing protein, partial [Gaiellaceae bacterium]